MVRSVVARPEGLELDGELVAWAKTSEPELYGGHARIRVIDRNGPADVVLFFERIDQLEAVKELRARALFIAPRLGPYRG